MDAGQHTDVMRLHVFPKGVCRCLQPTSTLKNESLFWAGGCTSSFFPQWEMILERVNPAPTRLLTPPPPPSLFLLFYFSCPWLCSSPPHHHLTLHLPASICKWCGLSAYCQLQPARPFITCRRLPAPPTLNCSLSDLQNGEWCSLSLRADTEEENGERKKEKKERRRKQEKAAQFKSVADTAVMLLTLFTMFLFLFF